MIKIFLSIKNTVLYLIVKKYSSFNYKDQEEPYIYYLDHKLENMIIVKKINNVFIKIII